MLVQKIKILTTTTTSSSTTTSAVVKITDFGAHSITETGYESFDSSAAINKAIVYAKANGITSIDFGSGKYYAKEVNLVSGKTYFSTERAELIAAASSTTWSCILRGTNKNDITISGLTLNGNKKIVSGTASYGSQLIVLTTCGNININNCYLYNNWSTGILIQDNCNYVTVRDNTIYDTDCGVLSQHVASNNLTIDRNIIYGSIENQVSEPISIYNDKTSIAHDITITNNIVHDKLYAASILILNATNVTVKGNTSYNCYSGIDVGFDDGIKDNLITVSSNITITENIVYNCTLGIIGEMNNSIISENTIRDLKGLGIQLKTKNTTTLISGDTIIGNTVSNVNNIGTSEPPIRLSNTQNCIIDKNIVSDTRTTPLHVNAIEISGSNCTGNIIQNNDSLGRTKSGYQIYISAKNTTLKNNTATILDYGTGTVIK